MQYLFPFHLKLCVLKFITLFFFFFLFFCRCGRVQSRKVQLALFHTRSLSSKSRDQCVSNAQRCPVRDRLFEGSRLSLVQHGFHGDVHQPRHHEVRNQLGECDDGGLIRFRSHGWMPLLRSW